MFKYLKKEYICEYLQTIYYLIILFKCNLIIIIIIIWFISYTCAKGCSLISDAILLKGDSKKSPAGWFSSFDNNARAWVDTLKLS